MASKKVLRKVAEGNKGVVIRSYECPICRKKIGIKVEEDRLYHTCCRCGWKFIPKNFRY